MNLRVAFQHDRAIVLHGDSMHLGDVLEPNSVDSLVTDPPSGISFMSKGWDGDKGGRDKWIAWLRDLMRPAFRALKPGAHGLVWALPRTSHWTVTALEDCGFEIRDVVMHVFGSGFPKSLDVSKSIDATLGAEREVVGSMGVPGALLQAMSLNGTDEREHWENGHGWTGKKLGDPVTDEAKEWSGWGTALKPAAEHWILVRKPTSTSVARNVLSYGTGALNVAGCRIGDEEMQVTKSDCTRKDSEQQSWGQDFNTGRVDAGVVQGRWPSHFAQGRWPSHFALSHSELCVVVGESTEERPIRTEEKIASDDDKRGVYGKGLDRQTTTTTTTTTSTYACVPGCPARALDSQSTGVSRFFFTAKPATSEKDAGLKDAGLKDAGPDLKAPLVAAEHRTSTRRNVHPTVKPIALMRWLCRLITPPGGVILDPFAGSGTTGVAAIAEGFSFVGCEMGGDDGAYMPILVARIRHALGL